MESEIKRLTEENHLHKLEKAKQELYEKKEYYDFRYYQFNNQYDNMVDEIQYWKENYKYLKTGVETDYMKHFKKGLIRLPKFNRYA